LYISLNIYQITVWRSVNEKLVDCHLVQEFLCCVPLPCPQEPPCDLYT